MGQSRLDPFGSGTFFIRLGNILFRKLKRLNPFGSGTFFIPWALFFLFCLNGLEWFFPGFGVVGKLLHFYHVGWFWATCRLWGCLFSARMFWGEAVADWRSRGSVVFMGIFMWRVFSAWSPMFCIPLRQGFSVVRERFLAILWRFFHECHFYVICFLRFVVCFVPGHRGCLFMWCVPCPSGG